MVDLTRYDFLFKRNNPVSKNILKNVLEGILEALDEKGTVACAVPRPWYAKGFLAYGKSVFFCCIFVEDLCYWPNNIHFQLLDEEVPTR